MLDEWVVNWCKECDTVGVSKRQVLTDVGVVWANWHYEQTHHTKIASMGASKLKSIFDTALELIAAKEEVVG